MIHETFYESGKIKTSWQLNEKGQRNGLCQRFRESGGLKAQCFYKKGISNGLYESFFANGEKIASGRFVNNFRKGFWLWRTTNSEFYF